MENISWKSTRKHATVTSAKRQCEGFQRAFHKVLFTFNQTSSGKHPRSILNPAIEIHEVKGQQRSRLSQLEIQYNMAAVKVVPSFDDIIQAGQHAVSSPVGSAPANPRKIAYGERTRLLPMRYLVKGVELAHQLRLVNASRAFLA